jgi:hypothetical protein
VQPGRAGRRPPSDASNDIGCRRLQGMDSRSEAVVRAGETYTEPHYDELQHQPVPTLVVVDESSAIAPGGVVRLFGRGRSAGLSLLLGTRELADLRPPDNPTLADHVVGNVTALIARRQMVPASAETLAGVMGTRGAWTWTERTDTFLGASRPTGDGTRTRTREFVIHPDTIKRLPTSPPPSPARATPNPHSAPARCRACASAGTSASRDRCSRSGCRAGW